MRRLLLFTILSALVLVACSGPSNRVLSVSPSDGATQVAVDAQIEVTFRGAVDRESLEGGFVLVDGNGAVVPGVVEVGPDDRSATFTPTAYLDYDEAYTATVDGKEIKNGKGDPPKEFKYSWSFQTRPQPVMTVDFTSHDDGQSVYGPRTVEIFGSIESGAPVTDVVVRFNGTEIPLEKFQSSFHATVTLRDNDDNFLEVLATNEAGLQDTDAISLSYPYTRLETFQAASTVIGQADFTSSFPGTDQVSVSTLRGNPGMLDGLLYLPDRENNRVLVYAGVPSVNEAPADYVLGQTDFSGWQPGTDPGKLRRPVSTAGDGRLALADTDNNRVLIWNTAPSSNEAQADLVLGQDGFDLNASGCSAGSLRAPESVFLVGGQVIVADSGNNRLLIWNSVPATNGQPADVVVGQSSFDSCAANDVNGDGTGDGPAGSTLSNPVGVWSDGERLMVVDSGNNRVLIWESFPISDAEPAAVVVGQSTFDSSDPMYGPDRLYAPSFLASNGNQLFVADTFNHRVLIWNEVPRTSGAPADLVLGQHGFYCNYENSDPTGSCWYGFDPSATSLSQPAGLHLFDGGLIVADGYNARYLVFEALPQP
jgi:hypothetical protein